MSQVVNAESVQKSVAELTDTTLSLELPLFVIVDHLGTEIGEAVKNEDYERAQKAIDQAWITIADYYHEQVVENAQRIADLGNWDEDTELTSLTDRVPKGGEKAYGGFDAGVACALGLIPEDKQKLSAIFHAAYTEDAVIQVRSEIQSLKSTSETAWWLSACDVCVEGEVDAKTFVKQVAQFKNSIQEAIISPGDGTEFDPAEANLQAARRELMKMQSSYGQDRRFGDDVAFGTEDGCIQGAYFAGHPFGIAYNADYDRFFVGTYTESLGLDDFEWSDQTDDQGRAKSGPVHGNKQFVMCADEEEVRAVLEVLRERFAGQMKAVA